MYIFAHIFIGKEYKELVKSIGCATLKYGGSTANANINYLVADCEKGKLTLSRLVVESSSKAVPELVGTDYYTNASWEDKPAVALSDFTNTWRDVYNALIDAEDDKQQLNVMLHFPLYKSSSFSAFQAIYEGVVGVDLPTRLNFLGYCSDLAKIVEPNIEKLEKESSWMAKYTDYRKQKQMPVSQHLIVLQNTNRLGITLNLGYDSLVEVISHFAISCSSHYDVLFDGNIEYQDVVAFGVSVLSVDRFLMADYLLNRIMLNAMDTAAINESQVDSSLASQEAHDVVKDKLHILSNFFNQEEKLFSEVHKFFAEETQEVLKKCEEKLLAHKSIPVRTAILATLLSKTDCSLFSQTVFDPTQARLCDLFSEGIDFFIANDYGGYYSDNSTSPVNPIPELKELEAIEINLSSHQRNLKDTLEQLEQQIKGSQDAEHCYFENGVFHFQGHDYRLMPDLKQELLEETFQPQPGKYIPESIDLRSGFRPVQNQGSQGSCLAHALTAIYEYAIKLNTGKELDLSEAFLYYNAREMDNTGDVSTTTDIGSRVRPAIESLGKYGLAQEEFCRYNEDDYTTKPSEEAYEDASKRRLLKALNVDMSTQGIKAALAEGYPVAVSLALCESFLKASNDGYVPMPTAEEIERRFTTSPEEQERHSSHAMVVVGYSDKLGRFIVRNSWDTDWGDAGYCYVPFEYIDHEKLCQSATIITEVDSLSRMNMDVVDIPTLSIDSQDLTIRYYINQAALQKVEQDLIATKERRRLLYIYFLDIVAKFSDTMNRKNYLQAAEKALTENIDEMQKRCREISSELEDLSKAQRRFNVITVLKFICATGVAFALIWLFNRLMIAIDEPQRHIGYLWSLVALVPYGGYLSFIAHKHWKAYREEKHGLENEYNKLKELISQKEKIKKHLKYKVEAAFGLMQGLNNVMGLLETKYQNYIKLINNLRVWYEEIRLSEEKVNLSKSLPTISLLEQERLDLLFENELKSYREFEIDFCSVIAGKNDISDVDWASLRRKIVDDITVVLCRHPRVADFSITKHAAKSTEPWVVPVDKTMGRTCAKRADMFMKLSKSANNNIVCSSFLFAPDASNNDNKLSELFVGPLSKYNIVDNYRMVYITISVLRFGDCAIFT